MVAVWPCAPSRAPDGVHPRAGTPVPTDTLGAARVAAGADALGCSIGGFPCVPVTAGTAVAYRRGRCALFCACRPIWRPRCRSCGSAAGAISSAVACSTAASPLIR